MKILDTHFGLKSEGSRWSCTVFCQQHGVRQQFNEATVAPKQARFRFYLMPIVL